MTAPDLPDIGRRIAAQLDQHFDPAQARTRQVLALVEEAGEVVDAYLADEDAGGAIASELADVLITAHVTAAVIGVAPLLAAHGGGEQESTDDRQVLALVGHASRFAACYRRAAGMARRTGRWMDVETSLATVVVAVYDTARRLVVDLDAAVAAKVEVMYARGWRDPRPDGPDPRAAFDGSTVDATASGPHGDALYDGARAPEACDIDGSHDEVRPPVALPSGHSDEAAPPIAGGQIYEWRDMERPRYRVKDVSGSGVVLHDMNSAHDPFLISETELRAEYELVPTAAEADASAAERPARRDRPLGAVSPGDPDWVDGFGPVPGSGASS